MNQIARIDVMALTSLTLASTLFDLPISVSVWVIGVPAAILALGLAPFTWNPLFLISSNGGPDAPPRRKHLKPRELPPVPAAFVGRKREIEQLVNSIKPTRQPLVIVIYGDAGVGKSALAIKFAHLVADRFSHGQLYVRMWDKGPAIELRERVLRHFVRALGEPQGRALSGEHALQKEYASLTRKGSLLIVLDDIDPTLDIEPFLPDGPDCVLIVTCRSMPHWPGLGAKGFSLKGLTAEEALEMLESAIGERRVKDEPEQSRELINRCEYQPLALRATSTAVANRPYWALGLIVTQTEQGARIGESLEGRAQAERTSSLSAVYTLLTADEQFALRALHRFEDSPISSRMLGAVLDMDERRADRLAARLANAGLVERYSPGSGSTSYRVPDPVSRYSARLAEHAERVPPERGTSGGGRRLQAPRSSLPRHAPGAAFSADELLRAFGNFTEAIEAVRAAMGSAREEHDRIEEADFCAALAELHAELGDLTLAEDLARHAIARLATPASLSQALRCLSRIDRRLHRLDEAVKNAEDALNGVEELGPNSERVRALCARAIALAVRGGPRDGIRALQACLRAESLCKDETYPEAARLLPGVLWAQARVLLAVDRHAAALSVLEKARTLAKENEQNLRLAWIDYLTARIAVERLELDVADQAAHHALAGFAQLHHPFGQAHCRYALGRIQLLKGQSPSAIRLFRAALETFEGSDDRLIWGDARIELARAYVAQHRYREARKCQRVALSVFRELGDDKRAHSATIEYRRILFRIDRPLFTWPRSRFRVAPPRRRTWPIKVHAVRQLDWLINPTAFILLFAISRTPNMAIRFALFGVGALAWVSFLGWRGRKAIKVSSPAMIPSYFQGRDEELGELESLYKMHKARYRGRLRWPLWRRAKNRVAGLETGSPFVLMIHGPPGVGKTALARELASRLSGYHSDGLLIANMGTAGGPRAPREVLYDFLLKLGWRAEDMQGLGAHRLAGAFRAQTAGKHVLILLDAARSLEQIQAVLPGGASCTVIVTCRTNYLAGREQHALQLQPPDDETAAEIFLRATGRERIAGQNGSTIPTTLVTEVLDLCGNQPNALRVAAARARAEGPKTTLMRLRNEESRLDLLRFGGQDVAERFESEYLRLEPQEQQALLLLTIPESQTFVPWVLQPLLDIGSDQAGNLMACLSRVGLLDLHGQDTAGFARYRLSPLMRLFAKQRISKGDIDPVSLRQAEHDFRRTYLAGSIYVLQHSLHVPDLHSLAEQLPPHWLPETPDWNVLISRNIDAWIRTEFGCLVRSVHEAARRRQHVACWQIAARIGDCYAAPTSHQLIRDAFALAIESAREINSSEGELAVRIARAGYLATVTDYPSAIRELSRMAELPMDPELGVQIYRRLGHALHEVGDHSAALEALHQATALTPQLADRDVEASLVEGLRRSVAASHDPVREKGPRKVGEPSRVLPPAAQVSVLVTEARVAGRRGDIRGAAATLHQARVHCRDDLADTATLDSELVDLYLSCREQRPHRADRSLPKPQHVTWLAALALRAHERVGRPYGQARAHLAVARALLQEKRFDECLSHLELAHKKMCEVIASECPNLGAWLARLRGEVLLHQGNARAAVAALAQADLWFRAQEPYTHAETLVLLGRAHGAAGAHREALGELRRAERLFAELGAGSPRRTARRLAAARYPAAFAQRWGQYRAGRTDDSAEVETRSAGSIDARSAADNKPGLSASMSREGADPVLVGLPEVITVHIAWNSEVSVDLIPSFLKLRIFALVGSLGVDPPTQIVTLDRSEGSAEVKFEFTPERAGELRIRVQIYAADTGYLLQEIYADLNAALGDRASFSS